MQLFLRCFYAGSAGIMLFVYAEVFLLHWQPLRPPLGIPGLIKGPAGVGLGGLLVGALIWLAAGWREAKWVVVAAGAAALVSPAVLIAIPITVSDQPADLHLALALAIATVCTMLGPPLAIMGILGVGRRAARALNLWSTRHRWRPQRLALFRDLIAVGIGIYAIYFFNSLLEIVVLVEGRQHPGSVLLGAIGICTLSVTCAVVVSKAWLANTRDLAFRVLLAGSAAALVSPFVMFAYRDLSALWAIHVQAAAVGAVAIPSLVAIGLLSVGLIVPWMRRSMGMS